MIGGTTPASRLASGLIACVLHSPRVLPLALGPPLKIFSSNEKHFWALPRLVSPTAGVMWWPQVITNVNTIIYKEK